MSRFVYPAVAIHAGAFVFAFIALGSQPSRSLVEREREIPMMPMRPQTPRHVSQVEELGASRRSFVKPASEITHHATWQFLSSEL